ncbi:MAG: ABC-type transporter, substrate-binding lipoprotein [Chlamydiales bacterium]|jgi:manganese/zinc/iron transport system substrate-binding protein|nr:ABC-type transporter, substrate-binding lipoprotein [Chlamydiales bacterium]
MQLIKNLRWIFFLFILAACSANDFSKIQRHSWEDDPTKLKVLCTIEMISDIVRQIGGEHVDVLTLVKGDLNPHTYEFVKGDSEKFAEAELLFCNGLGLEHHPSVAQQLSTHPYAIALGNLILSATPDKILYVDGQPDPHIWMDIALWKEIIPHIVKALSEKDNMNQGFYKERGANLLKEFELEHQKVYALLQEIPEEKRYLVSSHDAFNYFTRSYLSTEEEFKTNLWKKRCISPEGLAPDSQISPLDIQNIIDHLVKYSIKVLFTESNVSKDSIRKILDAGNQKGLNIVIATEPLYADAIGPEGSSGDSYLKMLHHNATTIAQYLSK